LSAVDAPRGGLPELAQAARQELPDDDGGAAAALSPGERELIGRVWTERAASETGAGAVFALVSRGLFDEGLEAPLSWLAARAVCDELRHAELCRHVAAAYLGSPPPRSAPVHVPEPRFQGSSRRTSRLLHAVLQSAINESIGSAFLRRCLEQAQSPLCEAVVRELLRDEIDHARLGWALLAWPGYGDAARGDTQRLLPTLVGIARGRALERAAELPASLPVGHGCLPGPEVTELVEEAIAELVLPGFEHLGYDVTALTASA
jgi:hypothetical protein